MFADKRVIWGCEHFGSPVTFPLLFPSSVEVGSQPDTWTSFILWKMISLCKELVVQEQGGLGKTRHLFCRTVAVWGSSLHPQLSPFGLTSKATGLLSSCHVCRGWLQSGWCSPSPESPETLPAVSVSPCRTIGPLGAQIILPGDLSIHLTSLRF